MKFPNVSHLQNHVSFLRSDHVRFWFANHQDYFASFPAIHLSDTGPSRGIMKHCYHKGTHFLFYFIIFFKKFEFLAYFWSLFCFAYNYAQQANLLYFISQFKLFLQSVTRRSSIKPKKTLRLWNY